MRRDFTKMFSIAFGLVVSGLAIITAAKAQLLESERLEEYHRRGYTWPIPVMLPNTAGWRSILARRFLQLETTVPQKHDRYNIFLSTVNSALLSQNFTENGWGVTRAPDTIVDELKTMLYLGLMNNPGQEADFEEVTEKQTKAALPLFVRDPRINRKALRTLKSMHEEWAGVPLVEETAYGLRVYRNHSNLLMHVDRHDTHVISSILHVDHSSDAEPWPLVIEDFQGNTNEVVLESGDMLFYESSKCLHGRPRVFNGSWYSSIFIHYSPVGWNKEEKANAAHYAIPPTWSQMYDKVEGLENLHVMGTSVKEPECESDWCALANSVKWYGPAEKGVVTSSGGKKTRIEVPNIRAGLDHLQSDEL